jgi:hypothetical protein
MPLHSRRTAKPCPFRTPPRSSSSRCSLALVTNFSHLSLRVFRDLRTLSFFGSQLSRVLSAVCALFRKKPGVHPYVVIPGSAGILPASVPSRFRAGRMPALPKHGEGWASPSPTKTASHGSRDTNHDSLPTLVAAHRSLATSYIPFISPRYGHQPRIPFISHTYAKRGECTPTQKCRRADILDFSPYILHFFANPYVPASNLSATLRASGGSYTTQEGEASFAPTKNPKLGSPAPSPALPTATRHSPHASPSLGLSLRTGVQSFGKTRSN